MKRIIIFLLLLISSAILPGVYTSAQAPDLTVISGTVYKYDSTTATIVPASGASIYLLKIVKNGVIVSTTGSRRIVADASGNISFSVPRSSVITLQGNVIVGGSDLTGASGKTFTVPDASTATLEGLSLAVTATTTGLPIKLNNTLQTDKATTLDFGSGLTVTESPGGEFNVSSSGGVTSVAGRTGTVTLTKLDVGLSNADNTSDAAKPVSTATQTALNLKAGNGAGYIGMVAIAETINPHNPTVGGLPVIDGYQTADDDRVLLLANDQAGYSNIDNGVWVVHGGAWVRPADFANGSVHPSGALIFVRGNGSGSNQMFSSWVHLDNAVNDQATFTVGTDKLNSLSATLYTGFGPEPIEGPQGPLVDMFTWGRTDSTSTLGHGYALALQPIDFGGQQLVNAPDPTSAQGVATKNYVDAVQAAADSGLASKQNADADLTTFASLSPSANDFLQFKSGAWANRTPAQVKTDLALTASDVSLGSVTNDAQTKAAIVPNTLPTAGQFLVGNAGGTAYAKQSLSGDCTLTAMGVITCTKSNAVSFGSNAFTSTAYVPQTTTVNGHALSANVTVTAGDVGLGSVVNTDTTNAANISSGTLPAGRLPALTGDVTTSVGTVATTIGAGKVTNSMLVNSTVTLNAGSSFGITAPGAMTLGSTYTIGSTSDNLRFNNLGLGVAAPTSGGQISATGGANNITLLTLKRNTDTSPTGSFSDFQNAAGASLWKVDITGSLSAGTVPAARVSGLATSATTDTTNASNITTGTLPAAQIPTLDASKAGITYGRVTGSNVTTTGQSLVDITGLSVALAANTTYEVEVCLSANTSADINGVQYALQYSAAGATVEAWITASFSTTTVRQDRLSAFNTASGNRYLQTSAQDGSVLIKGTVTTGANAGTLSAQHLKATSGTSTVRIGSYLKATKIS